MKKSIPSPSLFSLQEMISFSKKLIYAVTLLFLPVFLIINSASAQQLQPGALKQIQSLINEKASRTPAQKKLSSQLWYAFKMRNGAPVTLDVARLRTGVVKDAQGKIKIEIDAVVTPLLLDRLRTLGCNISYSSEKFGNIVADMSLDQLEQIATLDAIKHISLWSAPMNNRDFGNPPDDDNTSYERNTRKTNAPGKNENRQADFETRAANIRTQFNGLFKELGYDNAPFFSGSVTSEADVTHKADLARAIFGVNGAGVKIGVLSDGITGYATSQASGDLPPVINILPGQAGNSGSEGRAMMELIYDLAPGADLYFATAFTSQASFAQNILALGAAGCDIIVDDVTYFAEGVFQDDNVAQAVNSVTASGALYFSSAGNSGNKNDNTAGVWEGDFVDGGVSTAPFPATGNFHSFSPGVPYNVITANTGNVTLKWSDPLGLSGNDYDLFVTDAAGTTIFVAGTNVQDGNDNPYEQIGSCFTGERLYILKKTAAVPRALHLNTNRGMITYNTPGVVFGHNAGANTISVAATPASVPNSRPNSPLGPFPGVHNSSNRVEVFSSDGPRRIFYNPDGTEITPGNLLFSTNGGTVLQKPDLTAADGTLTATPGFNPFFGTSAAAPHAAAIAALVKSGAPSLTAAQIKAALIASAIDIETPGVDRDAGAGIIMAVEALQAAGLPAPSYLTRGTVTTVEGSYGNGNGTVEPGELAFMTVALNNVSFTPATAVSAVLTTSTPGVTLTQNAASYGDIPGYGGATNTATPYLFGINASVPCGSAINFTLTVAYGGGGPSPSVFNFVVYVGKAVGTLTATLGGAPASGTGFTSTSGIQTNRTFRNGVASTCVVPKAAPGVSTAPNLAYHAYTFINTISIAQCVTVNLATPSAGTNYAVAYNNSGFIPATPGVNYLADAGLSNATQTFSFNAPPGQPFTIVVHEIAAGSGAAAAYNLTLDLRSCNVTPTCTPVVISTATLPGAVHGAAYSQSITATGGSGSYLLSLSGALPAGLSFSGNTLSGTPTEQGSFPITVTATDATGCPTDTKNYTLVVAPRLSIDNVTKNEGNSSTTTFTFTVSLSSPAGAGGVSFDIATADQTAEDDNPASEDNDYVSKSLTSQTIPEGETNYTFNVTVNGDLSIEPDEDFLVNVSNVTGAITGDNQGVGTITNDDGTLAPASIIASGGNSQSTVVNTAFALPLEVTVKNAADIPLSGVNVTFTAPASGASGTFTNSLPSITIATNASGLASAVFTANGTPGTYNTVASAGVLNTSFALTNIPAGPAASVLSISGASTICSGTTANLVVTITGGTSPFEVVYSNGTSNFTVNSYTSGADIPVSPTNTTTYSLVSVTDANSIAGSGNSGAPTITVTDPPTWYKDADNDNYSNGTTLTQCTRPTGYKLASELTAISGDCNDGNPNIKPGVVEICGNGIDDNCNGQTDENCSCVNVTVSAGTISCYGGLTTISVYASGGQAPYRYKLSGRLSFQWTNYFIVAAGTYSVTVMDRTGCTKTISNIVITQPAPLTLTLVQKTDVSCRNGSNGKIIVSAGGGTAPYSYRLNSGTYGSSGTFQNLRAGIYTVTARDAKGCTKSISVTIRNGSGSCSSFASTVKSNKWFLDAKLSPNPAKNEFTLQVNGNSAEPVQIRVADLYGRSLYAAKGTANQSYKFGHNFTTGVYVIEISQGEHKKTIKAVKE